MTFLMTQKVIKEEKKQMIIRDYVDTAEFEKSERELQQYLQKWIKKRPWRCARKPQSKEWKQ